MSDTINKLLHTLSFKKKYCGVQVRTSSKMVEHEMEEPQSFNNAHDLVQLCDTVTYFMHLKMAAMDKNANFRVPAGVDKIIELAKQLPVPRPEEWGSLAVGRISTKRKYKASTAGEDFKSKTRAKWSDEAKKELVELVDNEEKRKEKLGDKANHAGHINWTALARRYGFAGAGPLYRQYELMTGKTPPGIRPKMEGQKPMLEPEDASSLAWTAEKCDHLMRLVENEQYRKDTFGKKSLKWHKIGDFLGFSKKDCKKKYSDLTGKTLDD